MHATHACFERLFTPVIESLLALRSMLSVQKSLAPSEDAIGMLSTYDIALPFLLPISIKKTRATTAGKVSCLLPLSKGLPEAAPTSSHRPPL